MAGRLVISFIYARAVRFAEADVYGAVRHSSE